MRFRMYHTVAYAQRNPDITNNNEQNSKIYPQKNGGYTLQPDMDNFLVQTRKT